MYFVISDYKLDYNFINKLTMLFCHRKVEITANEVINELCLKMKILNFCYKLINNKNVNIIIFTIHRRNLSESYAWERR